MTRLARMRIGLVKIDETKLNPRQFRSTTLLKRLYSEMVNLGAALEHQDKSKFEVKVILEACRLQVTQLVDRIGDVLEPLARDNNPDSVQTFRRLSDVNERLQIVIGRLSHRLAADGEQHEGVGR